MLHWQGLGIVCDPRLTLRLLMSVYISALLGLQLSPGILTEVMCATLSHTLEVFPILDYVSALTHVESAFQRESMISQWGNYRSNGNQVFSNAHVYNETIKNMA